MQETHSSDAIAILTQLEEDPVLGKFLDFLAQDMEQNPQHIQPVTSKTVERVQSLVENVEIDLDAPLSDEDE